MGKLIDTEFKKKIALELLEVIQKHELGHSEIEYILRDMLKAIGYMEDDSAKEAMAKAKAVVGLMEEKEKER